MGECSGIDSWSMSKKPVSHPLNTLPRGLAQFGRGKNFEYVYDGNKN